MLGRVAPRWLAVKRVEGGAEGGDRATVRGCAGRKRRP